jgi:hypothetical protein
MTDTGLKHFLDLADCDTPDLQHMLEIGGAR